MKFKRFRDLKKKEKQRYYLLVFLISLSFNIMFFGATLNQLVIHYNNNRMPVLMYNKITYTQDNVHSFPLDITQSKLYFLADLFKIGNVTYSIGDFILYISGLIMLGLGIQFIRLDYKIRRLK